MNIILYSFNYLQMKLEAEYHNLSLWYTVSFIGGILYYFSSNQALSFFTISASLAISLSVLLFQELAARVEFFRMQRTHLFTEHFGLLCRFCCLLVISFALGIAACKYRMNKMEEVVTINGEVISNIEGYAQSIKPSTRGKTIILRDVKLEKTGENLSKVRLSIAQKYYSEIKIGDKVRLLSKLHKPQTQILPYSYDFGSAAYFAGISAAGYAMANVQILKAAKNTAIKSKIDNIRQQIYERLIKNNGEENGNFIAAILLGETKGIKPELMQKIRQAGISHILCVSGLHLSLIAMIFFASARFVLNLSDYFAFNYNVKLIAAVISLIASYGYLLLSGGQIAATRAFIMGCIIIAGVILGRRAYPLRSIGIAAFCILAVNPEYIFSPSFQLSFVAVLSLIAGYEFYTRNRWILGNNGGVVRIYLFSNIYSSFLAGILTAPVVINQFFTFPTYSVIMNLIAVPIMSFCLMPLGVVMLALMPFSLDHFMTKFMSFFIAIINDSVNISANLPGVVWYFGYINNVSLLLFLFGFFWICLWQTSWRIAGMIIMPIAFIWMIMTPKPDFILDLSNNTIGVKNKSGKLEIYSNSMSNFAKTYWANWFGQKNAELKALGKENIITSANDHNLVVDMGKLSARIELKWANQEEKSPRILQLGGASLYDDIVLVFCNETKCKAQIFIKQ